MEIDQFHNPYSQAEIEVLEKYYRNRGATFCRTLLPDRSLHSIRHKALNIGIKRRDSWRWSRAELNIVKKGIRDKKTNRQIMNILSEAGHKRTFESIRDKARTV